MRSKTQTNVLVGAITSFALAGLPGGPLLGGGLAGYLENGEIYRGIQVGIFSGGLALALFLVSSVITEGSSIGTVAEYSNFLWMTIGNPALKMSYSLLVLPLLGGAIGTYTRQVVNE